MAEIEQEVKTFSVSYLCDKCDDGEMIPTGFMLTMDPPLFPHECSKCSHEQNFHDKYPKLIVRSVP